MFTRPFLLPGSCKWCAPEKGDVQKGKANPMWQNRSPISATCTLKFSAECMFEWWHLQDSVLPRTNKSMLGSRAVQYFLFHSWNAGELSMAFIKKTKKTQESNHTCVCLCSHSGAVGDYSITRPGIGLGSRHFSGKAGRIHKEASQPLGIPWLSSTSFEMSNPTSASLHRGTTPTCACVHFLNVPFRSQTPYVWRQDLLREHPVIPQKGQWLTSSPSHVPIEALKCQIIKVTVNLKYLF